MISGKEVLAGSWWTSQLLYLTQKNPLLYPISVTVDGARALNPQLNTLCLDEALDKVPPSWIFCAQLHHVAHIYITCPQIIVLVPVHSVVVPSHPHPQSQGETDTHNITSSRGRQTRNIPRSIGRSKGGPRNDASQISQSDQQPRSGSP